jgi:hypothetical protein
MNWLRIPDQLALHVWWPGKFGVIVGDRLTGTRFALSLLGRYVIVWKYGRAAS